MKRHVPTEAPNITIRLVLNFTPFTGVDNRACMIYEIFLVAMYHLHGISGTTYRAGIKFTPFMQHLTDF